MLLDHLVLLLFSVSLFSFLPREFGAEHLLDLLLLPLLDELELGFLRLDHGAFGLFST